MLKAVLSPEIFISENRKEEGTTLGGETVSTDPAVIPPLSVFKAQSSERKGSIFFVQTMKGCHTRSTSEANLLLFFCTSITALFVLYMHIHLAGILMSHLEGGGGHIFLHHVSDL